MKRYILAMAVILLIVSQGFCQERQKASIYGEIVSVNKTADQMIVEYADYRNNDKKIILIERDNNTEIKWKEGLKGIERGYFADVDYVVESGKNIAKTIIIEKEKSLDSEEREP
ncbi:MAG: hypothetical protein KBB52_05790 [Candidatus Omnitrophica bacterium]|nr:hypothetical protein [Candidatus Omnitrophota bacterium]